MCVRERDVRGIGYFGRKDGWILFVRRLTMIRGSLLGVSSRMTAKPPLLVVNWGTEKEKIKYIRKLGAMDPVNSFGISEGELCQLRCQEKATPSA